MALATSLDEQVDAFPKKCGKQPPKSRIKKQNEKLKRKTGSSNYGIVAGSRAKCTGTSAESNARK
jgi:hypothetical protein